jgi:maltose/maltodextrin transport system substrate-binding protein
MNPFRRRLAGSGIALAAGLAGWPVARAASARTDLSDPLVIWFTVEGAKGMRRVAEAFTAATGVPVVVETPDNGPSKFQQAASAGKGPDIYIYAHDRVGEWVEGGLLHAVSPSRHLQQDIDALAWDGFRWQGRTWGYPYALEAITLIYNKALVPTPPTSFEEVFAIDAQLAKQGKKAIIWDYTNNYFTWPLLAANGGYAFKRRADGSYDAQDVGVANAGALAGAELLDRMVREGLMPSGMGYPEMEAALAQGRVAMMINGPWAWVNLKRTGIDFGVARIPKVAGHAAVPYVGSKGLFINRATRKRELAVEFIENYLLTLEGLRAIDQAEPIGAPASKAYYVELLADPGKGDKIAGIMASARDGVITPCIPEMGRFWSAMKSSLTNLTEGRQTPREAMEGAARRIREAG